METLKFSLFSACHTKRTFVRWNVPSFPRELLKFITPLILLYTSSFGRSLSSSLAMIAPRNFKSRYSLDLSYALCTACSVRNAGEPSFVALALVSAPTDRSRLVNMNSKRLPLNLVITYSALVTPRSRLAACFTFMEVMLAYPMLRFARFERALRQMTRRLVMVKLPASPLLPLVSSTLVITSITNSPSRSASVEAGESNLISRSCHTTSGPSALEEGIARARAGDRPPEPAPRPSPPGNGDDRRGSLPCRAGCSDTSGKGHAVVVSFSCDGAVWVERRVAVNFPDKP